jgi:hypothetical protein
VHDICLSLSSSRIPSNACLKHTNVGEPDDDSKDAEASQDCVATCTETFHPAFLLEEGKQGSFAFMSQHVTQKAGGVLCPESVQTRDHPLQVETVVHLYGDGLDEVAQVRCGIRFLFML